MGRSFFSILIVLFAGSFFIACQQDGNKADATEKKMKEVAVPVIETGTEVVSNDQFGSPLYSIQLDSAFTADKDSLLDIARSEIENGTAEQGARTLLGRRYMELARYEQAIQIFSENLSRNPGSLEDHRYKAECNFYLQNFDNALSDLEDAKELSKQLPNQIEYEVDATSAIMPVYNLHFNTFYYMALTYFVKEDYEQAARTFGYAWNNAANDDLKAMLATWLALSYRKQGMEGQAKAVLEEVTPEMKMIKSPVYRDLGMMYKGYMSMDGMLEKYSGMSIQDFQISRFGVAMWYLLDNQPERAKPLFKDVIDTNLWNTDVYAISQAEYKKL